MKRVFLIGAIGIAAACLGAVLTLRTQGIPSADGPVTAQLTYDAGAVFVTPDEHRTAVVGHAFRVRNSSSEEWNLNWTGSSCGCTKPERTRVRLSPGQETLINVRVDAQGKTETLHEYAEFQTGGSRTDRLKLVVTARIYPRLSLVGVPTHGVRVPADDPEFEVTASVFMRQPLPESAVHVVAECVDAEGVPMETTVGRPVAINFDDYRLTRFPVTISLGEGSSQVAGNQGPRSGRVIVRAGDSSLEQPFTWSIPSAITTTPKRLFLQCGGASQSAARLILRADQAFQVQDINMSIDSVTVESVDGDNSNVQSRRLHQLVARAKGLHSAADGERFEQFTITFSTSHPDQPRITIPATLFHRQRASPPDGE